jgi:hypothetical protein
VNIPFDAVRSRMKEVPACGGVELFTAVTDCVRIWRPDHFAEVVARGS